MNYFVTSDGSDVSTAYFKVITYSIQELRKYIKKQDIF